MNKQLIFLKDVESLLFLENKLCDKPLITSDDRQNKFYYVEANNKVICGITYYNYGIRPSFVMENNNRNLWIGFGKKVFCIDIFSLEIKLEEELVSIFYEVISDSVKKYICVICELDIYCFTSYKNIWKVGFKDIINEFEIDNDKKIKVRCNTDEFLVMLANGKVS